MGSRHPACGRLWALEGTGPISPRRVLDPLARPDPATAGRVALAGQGGLRRGWSGKSAEGEPDTACLAQSPLIASQMTAPRTAMTTAPQIARCRNGADASDCSSTLGKTHREYENKTLKMEIPRRKA